MTRSRRGISGFSLFMIALIAAMLAVIVIGYWTDARWPGFRGVSEHPTFRSFWDWMDLIIIPAVLTLVAFLFNSVRERVERDLEEKRSQDQALQQYLDRMAELILGKDLAAAGSDEQSTVRGIARVRTLTILGALDGNRKATVLSFLAQSRLLPRGEAVLDLDRADLSGIDFMSQAALTNDSRRAELQDTNLRGANLQAARLAGVNLNGSNLSDADLTRANLGNATLRYALLREAHLVRCDLRKADLRGANLRGADLRRANLQGANLYAADLTGADLEGANLIRANLNVADLSLADLHRARLGGAYVERTTVKGCRLDETVRRLGLFGDTRATEIRWLG